MANVTALAILVVSHKGPLSDKVQENKGHTSAGRKDTS